MRMQRRDAKEEAADWAALGMNGPKPKYQRELSPCESEGGHLHSTVPLICEFTL